MIERASSRSPAVSAMIGRALHAYWRFSRGLTLGVRGVVLDEADRVFLIRHTYVPGWHLPGGGVETGETALEALARELAEEGASSLGSAPSLHGVFFNGASRAATMCSSTWSATSGWPGRRSRTGRSPRRASFPCPPCRRARPRRRGGGSTKSSPRCRSSATW